ncbi:GAF and ANTAR domain-containing protein [Nocardioides campestrisoli]|uniref:GAF and ANTAR domain-containing protein n=1 Tax=Nocardioides campestrisoli TaxID=2736757 RepID=UPI00163D8D7E|nr:GAF and ANTAR domain-containing protein [Nocardioides campestrisoli]
MTSESGGSTESSHFAAALSAVSRSLHAAQSVEESLDLIVETVLLALPDFEHAGVSIRHRDGRIETRSSSSDLVRELDALQYELGEGPCVDAILSDPVMLVEDAATDPRWPRYLPQAVARGIRSQLGLQLYTDEETLGALNLYSTSPGVSPDSVHLAELFATQAALALGRARQEDNFNRAMATRKVIGQAMGIISERYQLPEERAFQFLVRVSQASNVKLHTIAAELVASTNEKYAGTEE